MIERTRCQGDSTVLGQDVCRICVAYGWKKEVSWSSSEVQERKENRRGHSETSIKTGHEGTKVMIEKTFEA